MTKRMCRRLLVAALAVQSTRALAELGGVPDLAQTYRVVGNGVNFIIEPGRGEPGRVEMEELKKRFTPEQLALLEKLNRADVAHLPRMRQLVVPENFGLDELDYSPLPREWASAAEMPKAIVVHLPGQVFGGYEYGKLVRWGPISSGSDKMPTPEGFHHLNWKSKGRHSTEDPTWYMKWYFNFQNTEGRALHALEMPGYPASHSCIRMLERDARWLYDWGEEWALDAAKIKVDRAGTPVMLVGQYDFNNYYPWRIPAWLARPVELPLLPQ
jgi:lipoprotein-anchoring transpeptidase ErfK/SrfK